MPLVNADQFGPDAGYDACQAGAATPFVMVSIDHPTMRALTCELLECECGCRVMGVSGDDRLLADAIHRDRPDLVVVDTGEFPGRQRAALRQFPFDRVIVIGPEPDNSYRAAALAAGAGAWVARGRMGDDLGGEVCRMLACPQIPAEPPLTSDPPTGSYCRVRSRPQHRSAPGTDASTGDS